MPLNVIHTAIDWENGGPQPRQYPPGTAFDCTISSVQVRYDYSSGGYVVTHILRVTGARGPDGATLPYPSKPG